MRKDLPVIAAVCALLLCGCKPSPEQVFANLKTAALAGDTGVIWENITQETRVMLAEKADVNLAGASEAEVKTTGYDHLQALVSLLTAPEKERIKLIKFSKVNESDSTAIMSLVLGREGAIDRTLTFRKVDGNWLWDARDTLQWYIDNQADFTALGDL